MSDPDKSQWNFRNFFSSSATHLMATSLVSFVRTRFSNLALFFVLFFPDTLREIFLFVFPFFAPGALPGACCLLKLGDSSCSWFRVASAQVVLL